jgi:hypothetical protein
MATKNKTAETEANVLDFLDSFVDSEQKKEDSLKLIQLMSELSGFEPKMWGITIIGFGRYHYRYASGHEGDAPLIGFSPRKAELSLYIFSPTQKAAELVKRLGKFKMGKACIYIKRLSDIDVSIVKELCIDSIAFLESTY